VTGKSAGTATITATAQDGSGKSKSCTVTVTGGSGGGNQGSGITVTINPTQKTLNIGNTFQPTATASSGGIIWSINATGTVTITSTGLVRAIDSGTVTVTARSTSDGSKLANCVVTVNPLLDDDAEMTSAEITLDATKNVGLGVLASIVSNGFDSMNSFQYVSNTLIGQIFQNDWFTRLALQSDLSIANTKQEVINIIEVYVTNGIAYYGGRVLTDAVMAYIGSVGMVLSAQLIISGLSGATASLFAEALSLGTATPVVAVTTAVSIASVTIGAIGAGFSFALAANAVANGTANNQELTNRLSNGDGYYKYNFKKNLTKKAGNPPSGMKDPQAHHVLPQKFEERFAELVDGINIHDPKYGSWVPKEEHLSWSYEYNLKWENLLKDNPNLNEILQFARQLAVEYGYTVNF